MEATDAVIDAAIMEATKQALELAIAQDQQPMLRYFRFAHLPPHLAATSAPFAELATRLVVDLKPGPERTVALRKLLEAKDCAVRQRLDDAGA